MTMEIVKSPKRLFDRNRKQRWGAGEQCKETVGYKKDQWIDVGNSAVENRRKIMFGHLLRKIIVLEILWTGRSKERETS